MKYFTALYLSKNNSGASTGKTWWSKTKKAGRLVSHNPSDGKPLAAIYRVDAKDYDHVLKTAEHAFLSWRNVPAPKRGEVIHAIGEALRQAKSHLAQLVSLETGKSKKEGEGEVQEMIDMADFTVGLSRMLYGYTMPSERMGHRLYEQWHPLGVVGVITAFNFPVSVWAWNAFIAAICGNTVIWKPSPKASLCAVAVQHLCNQVMHQFGYHGIFSLLISDDPLMVQKMAMDEHLPLISFTGSTTVGRMINMLVAERLGKAILELSGNNAIIVDEDINLARIITPIVFSAIGTAGQRCTSTRRLFVHHAIYKKFVSALVKAYKKITIGNPLNPRYVMGPLIDERSVEIFLKTVAEAKQCGGKVLYGGRALKRPGFFVEPTLIEAKNDWPVVQRETFAPILYVMPFKRMEDAIQMQNQSAFGLSSACFTTALSHAEQFLSVTGSDCGIANINIGTAGAEIGGAFGGEKGTGGGREAGSDAWKNYMRRQTNTIYWGEILTLAQGIKFKGVVA
jgi:aldehyde dehydrogenase (NAD+)